MTPLTPARMETLLHPYLEHAALPLPGNLFPQLGLYLDLLLKWNARTNLTAIRDPETIVTRHFGESLFLACHLPEGTRSVLDLGSGAGFPGLPLQLLHPSVSVTLAESQHKKSSFLREAIRSLQLSTLVHAGRAEELVSRLTFDVVTLRAVDNMRLALESAEKLAPARLILSTSADRVEPAEAERFPIPNTSSGVLLRLGNVPRGT